eukprot:TRINITY_DN80233_c0_g1_i1.p1 TRINITY_DN80233_c0_g1~~TRINITY_DN80233_c0_g1_i1.p1  ORF type:complete len:596 (+),score=82.87 TRINITY_DN80233_c0_g1_i1:53-1840(+)
MEIGLADTVGLVDGLYHVLWKKRPEEVHQTESRQQRDYIFTFRVPDTIIFKRHRPFWWYFTSTSGEDAHCNRIRKKKASSLNDRSMYNGLGKSSRSVSGIVAVWYSTHNGQVRSTYFDNKSLAHFLLYSREKDDGALQVFIDPKPGPDGYTRNCVIQSVWQLPDVCLIEKRENRQLLSNHRLTFEERTETFEGYRHSQLVPVASKIVKDSIKYACTAIVAHFAHVSDKQVKRLVLQWKVDGNDNLWLLYCSEIAVMEKTTSVPLHLSLKRNTTSSPTRHNDDGMAELWAGLEAVKGDSATKKQVSTGAQPVQKRLGFSFGALTPDRSLVRSLLADIEPQERIDAGRDNALFCFAVDDEPGNDVGHSDDETERFSMTPSVVGREHPSSAKLPRTGSSLSTSGFCDTEERGSPFSARSVTFATQRPSVREIAAPNPTARIIAQPEPEPVVLDPEPTAPEELELATENYERRRYARLLDALLSRRAGRMRLLRAFEEKRDAEEQRCIQVYLKHVKELEKPGFTNADNSQEAADKAMKGLVGATLRCFRKSKPSSQSEDRAALYFRPTLAQVNREKAVRESVKQRNGRETRMEWPGLSG